MNLENLIENVIIFHGLTMAQAATLTPYLEKKKIREKEWVFRDGFEADGMYIIHEGTAQVWKNDQEKKQPILLNELTKNDCFGEMCLVDCQRRSASVQAKTNLSLYFLPYQAMIDIYEKEPKLYGILILNIAREISRRLRRVDSAMVEAHVGLH